MLPQKQHVCYQQWLLPHVLFVLEIHMILMQIGQGDKRLVPLTGSAMCEVWCTVECCIMISAIGAQYR